MGKVQKGILMKVLRLCSSDFWPRDRDQMNQCPYLIKFISQYINNEKKLYFHASNEFLKNIGNSKLTVTDSGIFVCIIFIKNVRFLVLILRGVFVWLCTNGVF